MVWVYVDGACLDNGKPWARAGYGVWFGNNNSLNSSGSFSGRQTNQEAELHAAIEAIRIATRESFDSLKIHTDSMYLVKGAKFWIRNWENNNWLTSLGEPVVSKDKWMELDDAMNSFYGSISWKYVKAHCGNYGNREADRLARAAAARSGSSHDDVLQILEIQARARANRLLMKNLQEDDSMSQFRRKEILEIMEEINDLLNVKLLNDCH